MIIRAVVFDVYKTILDVRKPLDDPEEKWQQLMTRFLGKPGSLTFGEFNSRAENFIAEEHFGARERGIAHPEIYWPDIAAKAFPTLMTLRASELSEFLYHHAQLRHTVTLMAGAGVALKMLSFGAAVLGIASNAQPYTLRELDEVFAASDISRSIFRPELCFWSFEGGFSKPSPFVFRWLEARLKHLGIFNKEILMIGDRLDNDILPARLAGWQVWHLRNHADQVNDEIPGGNWQELTEFLRSHVESGKVLQNI